VTPDEETTWFEDNDGVHTFRIEAAPAPADGAAPVG
jgi:hypothetical protein